MDATSSTLANSSLLRAVAQRLLMVWLPIIVVGVVIFWLSGGMPPASWLLLIQMLGRWSGLQATLGNGVFIPFAIVLVQCLSILLAWVILAFTIWREISVFNTLQAQQRMVDAQKNMARAEDAAEPLQSYPEQGVQVMPNEHAMNLFEEDLSMQPKNTGIQIVAGGNDAQYDSFDVNKAVFELPAETDESEAGDASAQLHQVEDEETVFVYGNPFDGELPEVFQYDMDLKRGVQDMQAEQRAQKKVSEEDVDDKGDKQNIQQEN